MPLLSNVDENPETTYNLYKGREQIEYAFNYLRIYWKQAKDNLIIPLQNAWAMRVNLIFFFANAAIFASWFYVPIFAEEDLGLNEFDIGVLFAIYGIALLFSSYSFGILSDRVGRKRFLYIGFAVSSIIFGLQAIVWDFWSLLVVRALAGFSIGIYPAALVAYVYEARKKMGKFSSFGSMGFGFGALIAGYIGYLMEIRYAFLFSSLLFVISLIIAVHIPPVESVRQKIPFFPVEVIKRNKMVYFSFLMRHSGAHAIWVIFPLYLLDLGATVFWIGVIHAMNAISQFFYMFFLTDRYSSRRLVTAGLLLSVLVFFLFFSATVWWQFLPMQLLLAGSWSFLYVGSLKYVTEQNVERATATGMLHSIISMSMILGAIIGGTIAYYF
ncbi:MAG: MFS transporter, partial [Thermoplasmata archaeon]|nr:MFS transporter [Thermoplasmata archaeon]